MTSPLNPALFEALRRRFGQVGIAKPGDRGSFSHYPDPLRPGHLAIKVHDGGEQYRIDCPWCSDTRQRLYVSHRYGVWDAQSVARNLHLLCCHNERCHQNLANRRTFECMVFVPVARLAGSNSPPPASVRTSDRPEMALPGDGLTLVSDLPADHPASAYLSTREYDLGELSGVWGISFCDWWLEAEPPATQRILMPVYRLQTEFGSISPGSEPNNQLLLAGWQARTVPGTLFYSEDGPKYLSAAGMEKSRLLYGLPQALNTSGPVVVCEGVTDVWRFGPGAVALFGKTLSHHQRLLLIHHFSGRPVVVLLDRDAQVEAVTIARQLQVSRALEEGDNRVVVAELPAGRDDPADCTRQELHDAISTVLGAVVFNNSDPVPLPDGVPQ